MPSARSSGWPAASRVASCCVNCSTCAVSRSRLRAKENSEGGSLFSFARKRDLDTAQVLQFTQQLAPLLAAGQPLDRALGILLELPESAEARKVIERIRETVRGGAPLSVALEQQHGLFSRLYVSLVRAGESGGGLDEALRRLADYLERSRELRSRVLNALTYPAFLVFLVIASVAFLLVVVVPQFEALFENLNAELAWYTQAVMWLSTALRSGWPLILAGILLLGWWLNSRAGDPAWRLAMDGRLLANRFSGPLVGRLETARLARTLGTLVGNGVPLLTALNLAGNVLSNRVLANAFPAGLLMSPSACTTPEWPREMRRYEVDGITVVHFQIDGAGLIEDARVVKSSGWQLLDDAAMRSLVKCRT